MVELKTRIVYAFRCFYTILVSGEIPNDIVEVLLKGIDPSTAASRVPVVDKAAIESPDRAVQMLALLQRDGRLIDFLAENVSPYPDAQLGAAIRSVHESCRQVLDRYVKLEPIVESEEDKPFAVQPGFDPAAIKLIGNVTGELPVKGLLRHRGWRVKQVDLPALPPVSARSVVAPAEVELP
jgi:hypothetical protein